MAKTMKKIIVILVVGGLIWWATKAFIIVDEAEYAIVTRFGRIVALHDEPGIKLKFPEPFERTLRLEKRTLYQAVPEAEYLSADKKNIVVRSYLTWRIADPGKFLIALRTREAAEARIEALVKSSFGAALGGRPFTDFIPDDLQKAADGAASANISALEQRVLEETMNIAAKDYGIEITALGVSRFNFPDQNLSSVFARMRAERERIAKAYRSEGEAEAQKIISKARRESAEIVAVAEAEAEITRGNAEAEAARIYAKAYEGHEDFFEFLRTLDVYDKIIDAETTVIIPEDSPLLDMLTKPPSMKKKR